LFCFPSSKTKYSCRELKRLEKEFREERRRMQADGGDGGREGKGRVVVLCGCGIDPPTDPRGTL